jgi:hypothetical protein
MPPLPAFFSSIHRDQESGRPGSAVRPGGRVYVNPAQLRFVPDAPKRRCSIVEFHLPGDISRAPDIMRATFMGACAVHNRATTALGVAAG